ncbi:MAG: nuclear transport factor 2 family protein [Solirubrobacteraceae bacterium]|nr:nuclear transport factor 2 family protein [Solirubrobacteraceae bacterium]
MSGADAFRAGVEARDVDAMRAALAPHVVLHSPVTFRPFEGRDVVGHVLATVAGVFEDFHYTDHLRDGATSILVFRASVNGREVDGIDLVREGADGLIEDFTVMVRPLSGLTALAEEMGRRLGAAPPPAAS